MTSSSNRLSSLGGGGVSGAAGAGAGAGGVAAGATSGVDVGGTTAMSLFSSATAARQPLAMLSSSLHGGGGSGSGGGGSGSGGGGSGATTSTNTSTTEASAKRRGMTRWKRMSSHRELTNSPGGGGGGGGGGGDEQHPQQPYHPQPQWGGTAEEDEDDGGGGGGGGRKNRTPNNNNTNNNHRSKVGISPGRSPRKNQHHHGHNRTPKSSLRVSEPIIWMTPTDPSEISALTTSIRLASSGRTDMTPPQEMCAPLPSPEPEGEETRGTKSPTGGGRQIGSYPRSSTGGAAGAGDWADEEADDFFDGAHDQQQQQHYPHHQYDDYYYETSMQEYLDESNHHHDDVGEEEDCYGRIVPTTHDFPRSAERSSDPTTKTKTFTPPRRIAGAPPPSSTRTKRTALASGMSPCDSEHQSPSTTKKVDATFVPSPPRATAGAGAASTPPHIGVAAKVGAGVGSAGIGGGGRTYSIIPANDPPSQAAGAASSSVRRHPRSNTKYAPTISTVTTSTDSTAASSSHLHHNCANNHNSGSKVVRWQDEPHLLVPPDGAAAATAPRDNDDAAKRSGHRLPSASCSAAPPPAAQQGQRHSPLSSSLREQYMALAEELKRKQQSVHTKRMELNNLHQDITSLQEELQRHETRMFPDGGLTGASAADHQGE